jgi:transcriptional regulator with XRE-family HTH domain
MPDREYVNLGTLIAKWRRDAALSQAALADALGTQQATVSKLESGRYRMSVVQLMTILDACGLTLTEIAGEIEGAMRTEGRPLWERINE